jgi:hypothetical protein
MTDETFTPPAAPPAKKMWTRCNGCQQRIYNDTLDIKIHAPICPQNMLLTIQKLNITVFGDPNIRKDPDSLIARTAALEQTVGDLDEHITTEPTLDPDGIDLDAFTDVIGDGEPEQDTVEEPATAVPQIDTSGLYPGPGSTTTDPYAPRPFTG